MAVANYSAVTTARASRRRVSATVRFPSINATTAAGERRDAGMGNDTVARVATVDMKNNWRGRLQPSPPLLSRYREGQRT